MDTKRSASLFSVKSFHRFVWLSACCLLASTLDAFRAPSRSREAAKESTARCSVLMSATCRYVYISAETTISASQFPFSLGCCIRGTEAANGKRRLYKGFAWRTRRRARLSSACLGDSILLELLQYLWRRGTAGRPRAVSLILTLCRYNGRLCLIAIAPSTLSPLSCFSSLLCPFSSTAHRVQCCPRSWRR